MKTILVVDDTKENIDILLELLGDDYDILASLSAKIALEIIDEEKIDLILLDIMMPDMDGFEMCGKLYKSESTKDIPIIFITALSDEESIEKAYAVGGCDYITKPFKPKELLAKVKRELELQDLQNNLKYLLEKELEKSRAKDQILYHQSKLAAMGEMIDNIAHQWRQPLSQINSTVAEIDSYMYEQSIIESKLEDMLFEIEAQTKYMSKTIDDFRNFSDIDKQKSSFSLKSVINDSLTIVYAALKSYDIEVEVEIDNEILFNGYKNELKQVILALLNNAKDILVAKNRLNPKIVIRCFKDEKLYKIIISDNAGGVDIKIIDKIFEPYFTTKHKTQGTGLGLYMSKMIIEDSIKGKLILLNRDSGADFIIELDRG